MSIAERIRLARGKISRANFARQTDLNVATVRNYEEGHSLPNSNTIVRVCSVFGLSPVWLLLGEGPMHADGRHEPPTVALQGEAAKEPASVDPTSEINALRQENRELRGENRELRQENRELLKQNADLRVEVAKLEARAAPDKGSNEVLAGESARKIA